jgi:uncharacterized protein (UPF0210 family)
VRALTLGLAARHPLGEEELRRAASHLEGAAAALATKGYEVQTLRVSTRPVLSDLAGWGRKELVEYACSLQGALDRAGLAFCSLGPALPGDGPEGPAALADMLVGEVAGRGGAGAGEGEAGEGEAGEGEAGEGGAGEGEAGEGGAGEGGAGEGGAGEGGAGEGGRRKGNPALSASVMVSTPERGVDAGAARAAAGAMVSLAARTAQGLGNFNFAALGCVAPGTPFFPAAYHAGASSLSVALQGAGIVFDALAGGAGLSEVTGRVSAKLAEVARPVVDLARRAASELGLCFGGIDLSPAPDLDDSIVAALEAAGHGLFGGPGTLALAAAVTTGLRSTGLPTCGYTGLMLPLMEDALLAQRWDDGLVGIDQLLAWSAVCGTGLDTVPVPGGSEVRELAAAICDMASLAARLGKPLSARLLPAPGKAAGERTRFSSPYLVNALIKPLSPIRPIASAV